MNRIVPLILLLFVLSACNKSNTDKAHDVIENYCSNTFFSPEDYKSIAYEDLKVHYSIYEETKDYKALDERRHNIEALKDSAYAHIYDDKKRAMKSPNIDSLAKVVFDINIQITNDKNAYKGEQDGWSILHSYYKKESGRVIQASSVFVLDKGLTRVLLVTDQ